MGTEQSSRTARSLADDLRGRTPGQIRRLLALRPDLLNPLPTDISQLARRAADDASVLEALVSVDTYGLRVLEVYAALHEATVEQVAAALDHEVAATIDDLWDRALLWGGPVYKIIRAAQQAFGPYPCGLSAASHLTPDPQEVAQAALDLDPDRLRYLVWEHPVSSTPNPLTVFRADQNVVPRETSLILRQGLFLPPIEPPRTPEPGSPAPSTGVWNVLAGVRYLLSDLGREPLAWNASRGVSRRVLTDRAATMAVPVDELMVWLEVAASAGLLGPVETAVHPTAAASAWLAATPADMWHMLIAGWLDSDRSLLACRPEGLGCLTTNGIPRTAANRRQILAVWPSGRVDVQTMRAVLEFWRPRAVDAIDQVSDVFAELSALGLLVGGVAVPEITSPQSVAIPATDAGIIVQPDQTIIAGANIDVATWELLNDIAKVESWGPVIGMRIDQARLRAAVTRREPADLLRELAQRSRTPLPQSLEYLANDAARGAPAQVTRATVVRVAAADTAAVQALGWQELAERTFVTDLPVDAARRVLADAGIAATGEAVSGVGLPFDYPRAATPEPDAVDRLVQHLVGTPEDPGSAPELLPADPSTLRETLRAARVWVEFNDGQQTLTQLVEPLEVRSGRLSGWSVTTARTISVPLSRIAAVRIAE